MKLGWLIGALALLFLASPAMAQGGSGCGAPATPPCNVTVIGGGGETVTANQGTAGTSPWPVKIDQTTPGTTNGVQTLTGSTTAVTSSALPTGAATSANQTSPLAPTAPASATATQAVLGGCLYVAAGITPTDGQQFAMQCGPSGGLKVGGTVASGATDVGSPVKVGGIYNSSVPTVTNGQRVDQQADSHGSVKGLQVDSTGAAIDYTQNLSFNPYPGGAVPVSCATGNVAATTATCTMPATTGKTTYVTGFDITASGATLGLAVTCTLTNTNSGTLSYTFVVTAGALLADNPLIRAFAPPLKATASNTAPVVSCPSLGTGNTNMTINAYGYEL